MKKLYFILSLLFIGSLANAAIIPITVQASAFSPASVNAVCGDTIIWVWGQSGSHTTTSTTIPGCATAWNAPLSVTSFTFAITIPIGCAGTYNYKCTPHGFTGAIIATCTNAVNNPDNNYFSAAYPSPFSNKLVIEMQDADMISIYNMVGEKIKNITVQNGQTRAEINASDLRDGIYFYCILKEGAVIETRKIIKN